MDERDLRPGDVIKRQRLSTRIWHWVNALTLLVLLMSGLMIFNAHPRLYWGEYGANNDPAWLIIDDAADTGFVDLPGVRIETTGLFGLWTDDEGATRRRAFPYWMTIPSNYDLQAARRWHLSFAWIFAIGLLAFMLRACWNGHVRRDLHIRKHEWSAKHIWGDISAHARLRFPEGSAAASYGILQKISYIAVIFVMLPLMILTGLAMSPAMNAAWPWLIEIFAGRQSARSLHFITAFALVGFFVVHIIMVLLAGPINELRSITTGRYRLPGKAETEFGGQP